MLRFGGAVMSTVSSHGFEGKCLAGSLSCFAEDKAYVVFDPIVTSFFDELSKFIRKSSVAQSFSDLQTFLFFAGERR